MALGDELNVVDYLWEYLRAQGVGRDPRVAGPLPPIWREPQNGTPAPGEKLGADVEIGANAVIGLVKATGVPPRRHEGFLRFDHVLIWLRVRKAPMAHDLETDLRALLNDKRNWDMAGLLVNESLMFTDLQPVGSGPWGYDYTTEYQFILWGPTP